jgi:hypothetical protein
MRGRIKDGRPPDRTPASSGGSRATTRNHDPMNDHTPTTGTRTRINKGHVSLKHDKSFYNITSNAKCKEPILSRDQGSLSVDILGAR